MAFEDGFDSLIGHADEYLAQLANLIQNEAIPDLPGNLIEV